MNPWEGIINATIAAAADVGVMPGAASSGGVAAAPAARRRLPGGAVFLSREGGGNRLCCTHRAGPTASARNPDLRGVTFCPALAVHLAPAAPAVPTLEQRQHQAATDKQRHQPAADDKRRSCLRPHPPPPPEKKKKKPPKPEPMRGAVGRCDDDDDDWSFADTLRVRDDQRREDRERCLRRRGQLDSSPSPSLPAYADANFPSLPDAVSRRKQQRHEQQLRHAPRRRPFQAPLPALHHTVAARTPSTSPPPTTESRTARSLVTAAHRAVQLGDAQRVVDLSAPDCPLRCVDADTLGHRMCLWSATADQVRGRTHARCQ